MGLFSTKTVINVGTSAMHLIDITENPVSDAVIAAILKSGVPYASQEDIPSYIMNSLLNGTAHKVDLAQNYARDYYKLGLPQGATNSYDPLTSTELSPYILGETGYEYPILVENSHFDDYTPGLAVYEHLLNVRDYDPETNEIGTWPAGLAFTSYFGEDPNQYPQRVEIRDVTLASDQISADIAYDLWVQRPTTVKNTPSPFDDTIVTEWILEADAFIENVVITGAAPGDIWDYACLFAVYKQYDSGGTLLPTRHTWVYRMSDGTYPELDLNVINQPDEFMPVIPIRYDNEDLTDEATQNVPDDPTNLWSTSKKLLRKYGMDLKSFGDKLNANPDIGEIDHAYVMWAVDLQSNHPQSLAYLTEFFLNTYLIQNSDEIAFLAALDNPDVLDEPVSLYDTNTAGGTFKEQGLSLDISFDYITTDLSLGSVGTGKVGYAEKSIQSYIVPITQYRTDRDGEVYEYTQYETRYKLILRSQVTLLEVRTVTVHNPKVRNYIYGDKLVETSLLNVISDEDEHNMLIPLQYNLTTEYTLSFRNALYNDCAMMVINTVQKTKLKWYQRGWFKIVLMIIAVVITVWAGQGWVAGLVDKMGQGVMAVLAYIGKAVLISLAAKLAFNWLIEEFGTKLGILGAIFLTVASIVITKGMGTLGTASEFTMSTAQYMLQTAAGLISSANEFLVQEGMEIRNEFDAFINKMEGLWEDLEDVKDLLKNKADVDPLTFASSDRLRIVPNESPTVFYSRCLGLPDNTMATIHDQIYNFMDARLRLDRSPDIASL
jgi:hypothetical protein